MPGEVEADKEEGKAEEESTAAPEATAPAPPRPVTMVMGFVHRMYVCRVMRGKTERGVKRNTCIQRTITR